MSHMENVSCTGSEKSLFQCSYSMVSYSCSPENVAGIICQGILTIHINAKMLIFFIIV